MWAVRSHAADLLPASLREPFRPDEHTVVLYHFDEGRAPRRGSHGRSRPDPESPQRFPLGEAPGFGSTARFEVREDDANLVIGPVNNDKLEMRTCERAWTVEAWVRYRDSP